VKKIISYTALTVSLVSLSSVTLPAENDSFISFNGVTGLINIPTAGALDKGIIDIAYNNQLELDGVYIQGHNFNFSVGLFDGLEVNGRIATSTMHDNLFRASAERRRLRNFDGIDTRRQIRDLSFNAKYRLPFIPKNWFDLAVGATEIGGFVNNYGAYYVAASKQLGDFNFSAGVGKSSRLTGQLDGVFAGASWQPVPWFVLQAEHDAEAFNAAAKIIIPKKWLFDVADVSLTSKFYTNSALAEKETHWGINISFPLGQEAKYHVPYEEKSLPQQQAVILSPEKKTQLKQAKQKLQPLIKKPLSDAKQQAEALKNKLNQDGFENVKVGFDDDQAIVVEFENSMFNRNEMDALGLVLGRLAGHTNTDYNYRVRLFKQGVALVEIKGGVANYQAFLANTGSADIDISTHVFSHKGNPVSWLGTASNSPYFSPRISLAPALSSTYAIELGTYDYSLAIRADVNIPIWYGAGVNISAQKNVANTDDFEQGKALSSIRQETGVKQATVYQTVNLPYNIYNQTHVGYFSEYFDFLGITNETSWQSNSGKHKVTAKFGYFDYQDYNAKGKEYYVSSYRYYLADKDVSFHVTAGQFFYGDTGYKLESKFWFGDSNITLSYSDTDAKFAAISFSIPFSQRKDMNAKYWQVKGAKTWQHRVRSRVGELNVLSFTSAYIPGSAIDLDNTFFNQDRMSSSYIKAHINRLRDAYLLYK
jgi:hypothetical protein